MRRCVRTSRPLSNRIRRFLPAASTAVTVAPTRRSTRGPGARADAAVTVRPSRYGRRPSAVRTSVSPSGIVLRASADRAHRPRARVRPLGRGGRPQRVAAVPHDEPGRQQRLAKRRRATGSPSTLPITSSRTRPSATRSARERRRSARASGSSAAGSTWIDVPPRSRYSTAAPSTITTYAPAARWSGRRSSSSRRGQGIAAPYGLAGSAAARRWTTRPCSPAISPGWSRSARSRSTAPGSANWAAPRPSTKYPRRIRPASSIARRTG